MFRLGLTLETQLVLDLGENDFRSILKFNTDGSFNGSFITDFFSKKHTKYKGDINENNFQIKFKSQLLNFGMNYPIISGTFKQEKEKLRVDIEVSSMGHLFYLFLTSLILSLLIVSVIIYGVTNDLTDRIVMFLMILIVLIPIISVEFFRMRTGVKKAIKQITSDFYKMTRKMPYNSTNE